MPIFLRIFGLKLLCGIYPSSSGYSHKKLHFNINLSKILFFLSTQFLDYVSHYIHPSKLQIGIASILGRYIYRSYIHRIYSYQ